MRALLDEDLGLAALAKALLQALGNARADEMRDVATQHPNLLDEARGDELETVGRHEEHRLDLGIEAGVHPGHLKLVLEVGHGAKAADDDGGIDRHGEMHEEVIERA